MTKSNLTPQRLTELLAASPEGFFDQEELNKHSTTPETTGAVIAEAVEAGKVGHEGNFIYDLERLTPEQVRERGALYVGSIPSLNGDGAPNVRTIKERLHQRKDRLARLHDPVLERLIDSFEGTPGYLTLGQVCIQPGDEGALAILQEMGLLKRSDDLIFDPLRITRGSLKQMRHRQVIAPVKQQLVDLLQSKPGQTAPRVDLIEQFGANILQSVLETGGFSIFSVPLPVGESVWIRLKGSDAELARKIAIESVQPKDEDWDNALDQCGDMLRPGATDGPTRKEQALARSYILSAAASLLGIRKETLQTAIADRRVIAFIDPEGAQRIAVTEVQAIQDDREWLREIEDLEVIRTRELMIVLGEPARAIEQRLRKARIGSYRKARWGQLAGKWNLPQMLPEFRALYTERKAAWQAARDEQKAEERRQRDEERRIERTRRDEERRQREELRARLLASFPTWQHAGRAEQEVVLHIGPPNSGKTHEALNVLSVANSGWYLAPLRLLAFEVFDRLNQRGIRCNLLTGEEHIPVPGATVTAATIEMFNSEQSGDCVVIDEAQMLADPDRGWAWTRALMEAQAPKIHVIGPPNARTLIERLARAAEIPIKVIEHERLAPIEIARQSWPVERLPERTILVAFSRRMVLHLKTELEMMKRRVSVVYGNLPPEVRRKQADRFADGQTEICVSTDAVGMGLNLPADNVCFFELEKFDGKSVRQLTPSEVHQIGGRAGRYGLSSAGVIGATTRRGLKTLQQLYAIPPEDLTHARVAPEVEDLELIPGSLSHRFARWSELQSIPDSLRNVIKPADIDERIALARMLTDPEVVQLGLPAAVKLVNAPTREQSRNYWRLCTLAILDESPMPLPPDAPLYIDNDHDLDVTEESIACADIYLWLSHRREFSAYAPDEDRVRERRTEWSMSIDAALLRRLDTLARCVNCRQPLPLGHRYSLCDNCYSNRHDWWW